MPGFLLLCRLLLRMFLEIYKMRMRTCQEKYLCLVCAHVLFMHYWTMTLRQC